MSAPLERNSWKHTKKEHENLTHAYNDLHKLEIQGACKMHTPVSDKTPTFLSA